MAAREVKKRGTAGANGEQIDTSYGTNLGTGSSITGLYTSYGNGSDVSLPGFTFPGNQTITGGPGIETWMGGTPPVQYNPSDVIPLTGNFTPPTNNFTLPRLPDISEIVPGAPNVKPTVPPSPTQSIPTFRVTEDGNSVPTTVPSNGAGETGSPETGSGSQGSVTEPIKIDSFEEFLQKQQSGLAGIRDSTTQYYDEQNKKTLEAIEAQRQVTIAEANKQKGMADTAIAAQKTADEAQADAQKTLLENMSAEMKKQVYDFAAAQKIDDLYLAAKLYAQQKGLAESDKAAGAAYAEDRKKDALAYNTNVYNSAKNYADGQYTLDTTYATNLHNSQTAAAGAEKTAGETYAKGKKTDALDYNKDAYDRAYAYATDSKNAVYNKDAIAKYEATVAANNAKRGEEIAAAEAQYTDEAEHAAAIDAINAKYDQLNQDTRDSFDFGYAYDTHKRQTDAAEAERAVGASYAGSQRDAAVEHNQAMYDSASRYAGEQYDLDTSYNTNLYNKTMVGLDAEKASANTYFEKQKAAADTYAEGQLAADTSYANNLYGTLTDAINAQYESGRAMAEDTKKLLLSLSEEQRANIYAQAAKQREAAETSAEVERERGVVDARSSYEQNKASYGAQAERMGSMGLSGSGYGDYLNSRAYAQQRAETQAANSQAASAKRAAQYTEDQAKLGADADYYQNKYNAEQNYSERMYDIDTSYRSNMLSAEQQKAQSLHQADATARNTKYNAETQYNADVRNAESAYNSGKTNAELNHAAGQYQADSQKAQTMHQAEQTKAQNDYAANAQYDANMYDIDSSYRANMYDADQTKAQSIFNSEAAERDAKYQADQTKAANDYAANSQYDSDMYNIDSSYRANVAAADQNKLSNDHAAASNQAARVQEADQNKLASDHAANSQYDADLYNIDSSYRANISAAEQSKAQNDHAANSAERETKLGADQADAQNRFQAASAHSQAMYEADTNARANQLDVDTSYSQNLFDANQSAEASKFDANQTADAGKFGADLSYKENVLNLQQKAMEKIEADAANAKNEADAKSSYYASLLDMAKSGDYSAEEITDLANKFGLDATDTEKLSNTATETVSKIQNTMDKDFLSSVTAETTNAEINESDMSAEGKAAALQKKGQDAINAIRASIATGDMPTIENDMKTIESMHAAGEMDAKTYQTIKNEYNALFTPISKGKNVNASVGELADKGNNFKVSVDGMTTYQVESAGECTDTAVLKAASGVVNDGMFGYREKIYIKKDGKVYEIQKRKTNIWGAHDDWDKLYKAFFG